MPSRCCFLTRVLYYAGQVGGSSRFETRRAAVDLALVIRLYHGGTLDQSSGSLWATPDADYAAAFAQLLEGAL